MKTLFLRWVHDRRGVYQDEGMLVLWLTAVSLLALVYRLSDSGVLSRLQEALVGLLSGIAR